MFERRAKLKNLFSGLPSLRGLLPLVGLVIVWQWIDPQKSPYFPPPGAWWSATTAMVANGELLPAIGATLVTFTFGIAIGIVSGSVLGIVIGRSRVARRALGPLLEFCRGLPPPVIVPLAVLLLGYAESLKLLVVVWVAMWPILLNAASAADRIDALLIDVSRTFHLGHMTTLWKIVLPSVVPDILLGIRVAVPLAVIITLLVEMLTSLPGVGSLIVTSQRQFRSAEVYGLLIVVGLMGFLLNNLFVMFEQIVTRRWPPRAQNAA